MKSIFIIQFIVFLILTTSGFTQESKDSLLVVNYYKYNTDSLGSVINNSRYCPVQKTYNSKGVLIREIISHKEEETLKIITDAFCYYYYENNLLKSKEYYSTDGEIKKISVLWYDKTNQISKKEIYKIKGSSAQKILSKKYKYKGFTEIALKNYQNNTKSKILKFESPDSSVYKKTFDEKSKNDTIEYKQLKYFNNGKIIKHLEIASCKNKPADTLEYLYTYKDNNIKEVVVQKNRETIEKKYYSTDKEGNIKNISVFDNKFKKIGFIALDKKNMYRNPDLKESVAAKYIKKL